MLLARAWLLSLAQLIAASSQLTVELGVAGLGDLLGSMSRTAWSARPIYQFQGVPYAKSPGRHNRFKVHCYSCRTSSRILNIMYNLCRMRLIPKSVYVDCSSYLTSTSVNSRPRSHNFLVQRRESRPCGLLSANSIVAFIYDRTNCHGTKSVRHS